MDLTTRDAVDELLQTYSETGGINYLDAAATLPSRLAIEAACADLMSLMFPGFRSEALVSSEDLAETTRNRIRNLHARLKNEFCRSLGKIPPDETTEKRADEILRCFMSELPQVRKMLWTDIDAAYEGDPAAQSYEEIILAYPALEAIYRNRYSSRRKDWLAFLYRSWHRSCYRRDLRDRFAGKIVSCGHAWRAQLPKGRARQNQKGR